MIKPIVGIALALAAFAAPAAYAQTAADFPKSTVRIIVPFAAGGPTDVVMRLLAEQLAAKWNSPVLVENRPGAGTILATAVVAKAPADGHTLGVSTNSYVINPAIGAKVPYDTLKDFANVSMVVTQPIVLVAHPDFPANTIPELVEYAKKAKPPLNFASPGPRGSAHLAGELLKYRAGIDMTHINYKGSAAALPDVVSGRVPLLFDIWHSAKPYVDNKQLKVIATVNPTRMPELPDVATIEETFPGVSAIAFQALFAPSGTPSGVLDKISADVREVISKSPFTERAKPLGVTPLAMTPKEIDTWVQDEIKRWGEIAKAANITAD